MLRRPQKTRGESMLEEGAPCVTGCQWTTDGFSGYLWKKLPILDKIAYLIETPANPGILCLGPESIFINIIL